jgi:hypothetical protein
VRAPRAWFEVDELEPSSLSGWSVIIAGVTEPVTQPMDVRRLDALALQSWIADPRSQWIRIRARVVSGRRVEPSGVATEHGA